MHFFPPRQQNSNKIMKKLTQNRQDFQGFFVFVCKITISFNINEINI